MDLYSVVNTPLRRSGMACVLKGSHSFICSLHTLHSSANGMNNHTCLSLASRGWKAELMMMMMMMRQCPLSIMCVRNVYTGGVELL